jgi:polar amino acid transport system ATP-binding protein
MAVIGPSGGGKSTLLRIMGGLLLPDAGRIILNDSYLDFDNDGKLDDTLGKYRRNVGMVFQGYNLFHHWTALQNIVMPLTKVKKLNPSEASEIARGLLDRFQLLPHADKKPGQLSGGQKQRVAIVRALAMDARTLLFDEPTSALDPELTGEVLDAIMSLRDENRDIVIVTHEMGFARHACDYVVFISNGKVQEHGSSLQVFDNPVTPHLKNFLGRLLEWKV